MGNLSAFGAHARTHRDWVREFSREERCTQETLICCLLRHLMDKATGGREETLAGALQALAQLEALAYSVWNLKTKLFSFFA